MLKRIMVLAVVLFLAGSFGQAFAGTVHKHGMQMKKAVSSKKLVKCPITGTMINPAKAYSKTDYKGKTYYFCCAGCPEEFKKNPGKYAK
ncbi:MAG: YHS domain-containing protein [Candidatus Margulisiibacteriota bacterium]